MQSQYFVGLDITDFAGTVRRYNILGLEFAAISISFTIKVPLLPANIIETVKTATSDVLTAGNYLTSDDDIVVLAFQPNRKKQNVMKAYAHACVYSSHRETF